MSNVPAKAIRLDDKMNDKKCFAITTNKNCYMGVAIQVNVLLRDGPTSVLEFYLIKYVTDMIKTLWN